MSGDNSRQPETPAAQSSASVLQAAQKAAAEATAAASQAVSAHKSLARELATFGRDRRYQKCQGNVAIGSLVVAFLTLVVLGIQGWFISEQLETTKEQLTLASKIQDFSITQQLRQSALSIERNLAQAGSALGIAAEARCSIDIPEPLRARATHEIVIFLGHFELFHEAARRGFVSDQWWKRACEQAHKSIEGNCLSRSIVKGNDVSTIGNFSAQFVLAYENCSTVTN